MNFPTNPIEQRLLEVLRGHDVGDVCDRLWGDASDWRPSVRGYLVSSAGAVRRDDPAAPILRGSIDRDGYRCVCLKGRTLRVHRLVCEAFHGPAPDGRECAHLDGNQLNNRADNLAWVTHKENVAHMIAHGTINRDTSAATAASSKRDRSGCNNPNARFGPDDVAEIKRLASIGCSMREIGRAFDTNPGTISKIVRRPASHRTRILGLGHSVSVRIARRDK
jgi:hypothetical protein